MLDWESKGRNAEAEGWVPAVITEGLLFVASVELVCKRGLGRFADPESEWTSRSMASPTCIVKSLLPPMPLFDRHPQ